MSAVLFIGIGNMGWPMAGHLVAAAHDVVVADVDPARERRFATEVGGRALSDHPDARPDVIVTMLPTSAIVRAALLGDDTRVGGMLRPGVVVVDMSSSQPLDTIALADDLGALGVRVVDAPVSGGVTGAEAATLTVMTGGDPADIDAVAPILEALGGRIVRTGAIGSAHATKALNNFVAASGFAAACEALLAARAYGLDPTVFLDILNTSTGRNFATDFTLPRAVVTGTFDTGFPLALLAKDVGIAHDLARSLGVPPILSDVVSARLVEAVDQLPPGADNSEAILAWERRGPDRA